MNYVRELSELMRGESYWLAHTSASGCLQKQMQEA